MICQPFRERIWKLLAEERDIGLHDARFRNVIIVILVGRVCSTIPGAFLLLAVSGPLSLHGAGSSECAQSGHAPIAAGDPLGPYIGEDGLTGDLVLADETGRSREGAVALDQLFREDASNRLQIVDVLGVIGEQLSLLLKEVDEFMSWGVAVDVGKDDLGD